MLNHTSFRIGGPADILVVPNDLNDIKCCVNYAKEKRLPITVIGNGTKLLVGDGGIRGLVIKIANTFDHLEFSKNHLSAGAGILLKKIVQITKEECLSGFEFAVGIPGTLGGALVMNAGTCFGSIGDIVETVTVFDIEQGNVSSFSKNMCKFTYRGSIFQDCSKIILLATFHLSKNKKEYLDDLMSTLLSKRLTSQPLDKPNAGSIFKNPPDISAGKLIDSVGLKGLQIGDAQISEKHANFVVNLSRVKASDVLTLIEIIQKEIMLKYGIFLIPELRLIGDFIPSGS